jgi:hypothetical protein
VAAEISLQDKRYETSAAVNRLFRETLDGVRRIPGVASAAVALTLPYERPLNSGFRTVDGVDREPHIGEWVYCTPGYFSTMGIPILRGRELLASDTADSSPVLVVSQSFASRYFPNGNALGGHIQRRGSAFEIVGIAGDVEMHSGLNPGANGPISIEPTIYFPAAQSDDSSFTLLHVWFSPKWAIRTRGTVRGLEARVQNAIGAVDPLLPVARFHTVDELRGRYTNDQRYLAMLFSVLAGLAVLLAAIGLYGLIGRGIVERQHEIGLRLALGATAEQTVLETMKPGFFMGLAGAALGMVAALAGGRLLKSMLWGVPPADPATLVATVLIVLGITTLASLIPALRILRLDPAQTLRNE